MFLSSKRSKICAAKSPTATLGMLTRRWWSVRFAGDALGDPRGGLKDAVRQRAGALAVLGQLVGGFDLRQDLRLADHHAVETGGDGEQMPHGVVAGPREQLVEDFVDRQLVEIGHELGHGFMRRAPLGIFAGRVDFHAIAGRQQHGLDLGEAGAQPVERGLGLRGAEGQPLAERDRGLMMAAANHLQFHRGPPSVGGRAAREIVSAAAPFATAPSWRALSRCVCPSPLDCRHARCSPATALPARAPRSRSWPR